VTTIRDPRSAPLGHPAQQPLPLDGEPELLRAVFESSGLRKHGYTFERALLTPPVRIALNNTALAALRARQVSR